MRSSETIHDLFQVQCQQTNACGPSVKNELFSSLSAFSFPSLLTPVNVVMSGGDTSTDSEAMVRAGIFSQEELENYEAARRVAEFCDRMVKGGHFFFMPAAPPADHGELSLGSLPGPPSPARVGA